MKKVLFILTLLVSVFTYGQIIPVNVLKLKDVTTAQRDGLSISANENPIIYNVTTGQYERWNGASWEVWAADGILEADIDTFAELDAIVGDETLVNTNDAQTLTNKTIDGGSNTLSNISLSSLQNVTGPIFIGRASGVGAPSTLSTATAFNLLVTAGSINPDRLADADFGDFTVAAGVASLDLLVVDTENIATGAVSTSKLQADAVESDKILNGTVGEVDLSTSVNASLDLADSAIQSSDLTGGAISPTFNTLTASSWTFGDDPLYRDWKMTSNSGDDSFSIQAETGIDTGLFTTPYTLNATGTPTDATDLTDKAYVDGAITSGALQSTDIDTFAELDAIVADSAIATRAYVDANVGGGGLGNVVEDLTPQLGGDLDLNSNNITGTGNVNITGNITASGGITSTSGVFTGDGSALTDLNGDAIVNGDYGDVSVASGVWSVDNVDYDNGVSGLTATTVQGAIDEVVANGATDDQTAAEVSYSNTTSGLTASTVQAAIDEVAAASLTDSGQGLSATTKSAGAEEVYDDSDITVSGGSTAKRKWNRHTANDTITLGTAITLQNQPWIETVWGADSLYIRKGTNANFYIPDSTSALVSDGLVLSGRETASIIGVANGSDMDFYVVCDCTTHVETASCTADPNEFATTANGTSDPNCNEANATTGFAIGSGSSSGTISAISSDQTTGTYSVELVQTGNGSCWMEYSFSATSGDQFTVTWDSKYTNGGNPVAHNWTGVVSSPSFNAAGNGIWEAESVNIEANATTVVLKFWTNTTGASAASQNYRIDNLSIVKTN